MLMSMFPEILNNCKDAFDHRHDSNAASLCATAGADSEAVADSEDLNHVIKSVPVPYILRRGYRGQIHCWWSYLIAPLMKVDMTAMPSPLPLTMKISTSSRRLLKYCATISVEQSRVRPTPTPTTVPLR